MLPQRDLLKQQLKRIVICHKIRTEDDWSCVLVVCHCLYPTGAGIKAFHCAEKRKKEELRGTQCIIQQAKYCHTELQRGLVFFVLILKTTMPTPVIFQSCVFSLHDRYGQSSHLAVPVSSGFLLERRT